MRPTALANLLAVVHSVLMATMVLSPTFAPWWLIAAVGAGVAGLDFLLGGCFLTRLEYWLRRRGGYDGRARSLMGRLFDLVGLRLRERDVLRIEAVILVMLVVQALFREVVG